MAYLSNVFVQYIAAEEAFKSCKDHAYLPQNVDERVEWQAHDWVIRAMQQAYYIGLRHGKAE